jgi:hypothetical protein
VTAFIDQHRGRLGVEPICRTLDVSASAYYQRNTGRRSPRAVEDERLTAAIRRVHRENYDATGSAGCTPRPFGGVSVSAAIRSRD